MRPSVADTGHDLTLANGRLSPFHLLNIG
ncbi:hypothetical protein SBA7_710008 [Candidatus Sulfotelmatobacter sp. SbA7]|nr:hypothetical protein SBA7_710008 [Candidatus Sulfotelmatobacter sp. SbA7]